MYGLLSPRSELLPIAVVEVGNDICPPAVIGATSRPINGLALSLAKALTLLFTELPKYAFVALGVVAPKNGFAARSALARFGLLPCKSLAKAASACVCCVVGARDAWFTISQALRKASFGPAKRWPVNGWNGWSAKRWPRSAKSCAYGRSSSGTVVDCVAVVEPLPAAPAAAPASVAPILAASPNPAKTLAPVPAASPVPNAVPPPSMVPAPAPAVSPPAPAAVPAPAALASDVPPPRLAPAPAGTARPLPASVEPPAATVPSANKTGAPALIGVVPIAPLISSGVNRLLKLAPPPVNPPPAAAPLPAAAPAPAPPNVPPRAA